jgi:hypothetical protein
MFSLEGYLSRIGYPMPNEKPPCTKETLVAIQRCHHTAIKFDNFDFHIRDTPITLDPNAVWEKVKDNKRGTYCFQGNYLMRHALQEIGFQASLVCVSSYRPFAGSYAELPSHCFVVVDLDNEWLVADAATVDCIDGIVSLSEGLETIQTTNSGVRYKFSLLPHSPFTFAPEVESQARSIDPTILDKNVLSITLIKEDVQRDSNLDPVQPIEPVWVPRFAFKLPLKPGTEYPHPTSTAPPSSLCSFPQSLNPDIAKLILEYAVYRDTRAHHYKQWLLIDYPTDLKSKKIVAGFRYIEVDRPYSARKITWIAEGTANKGKPVGEGEDAVPQEAVDEAFKEIYARVQELGVSLTEEQLERLNINHNFSLENVEHVWPL